jgi:predicted transcriptional regulator
VKNITDLKDSQLIETTPLDIYKTHNTIKKQLIESTNVKAIFPYLHPEYPELIEEILKNGGSIELIVPKNIMKALMEPIDKDLKNDIVKLTKGILGPNFTVIHEDIGTPNEHLHVQLKQRG